VEEMKPRVNFNAQKGFFSYQPSKLRKYSMKICRFLADLDDILLQLVIFFSLLCHPMVINRILQYKIILNKETHPI
jgi:hypothetical protein